MTGTKWLSNYDTNILNFFKLEQKKIKNHSLKKCHWNGPLLGYMMLCCEGVANGNPGAAEYGIIGTDHQSQVIGTISGGVGLATSFIAAVVSVICATEWAIKIQCSKIIVRSSDKTVMENFRKGVVPWYLRARWLKSITGLADIQYEDCYKEINFTAESLERYGTRLSQGVTIIQNGKPSSLAQVEMPHTTYHRV
ncbi:uncharacterized protein LOC113312223 [Papaver somniferum]|uniref:uncharacterized protein LOC113312223 n=1 Tax=Papaver somniferum TaxID=3469 RepID=UPI000E6F7023|nr:uncharacterized protein LOC113312223 [Papaver somniferum]